MTLGIEKRAARDAARRAEFEDLMPRTGEEAPLSCMMCRRCQVTPDTRHDIADYLIAQREARETPRIRIFCQKRNSERFAMLTRDCPFADPRPARPRELRRLWASLKSNHGDLGDRAHSLSEFGDLWLSARWILDSPRQIEAAFGHTVESLRSTAKKLGIGGEVKGRTRRVWAGALETHRFYPRQTKYLQAQAALPSWPRVLSHRHSPERRAQVLAQRERILDACHVLNPEGPRWDWEQVTRHLTKQGDKPAQQARTAAARVSREQARERARQAPAKVAALAALEAQREEREQEQAVRRAEAQKAKRSRAERRADGRKARVK